MASTPIPPYPVSTNVLVRDGALPTAPPRLPLPAHRPCHRRSPMDKEQTQLIPVATTRTTSLIDPQAESLPYPAAAPALLEVLLQPRCALFWGAPPPSRSRLAAATALAARGQALRIFDGGNRFDGYFVARLARRLSTDPQTTLKTIRLSRAFPSFPMAELIENTPTDP